MCMWGLGVFQRAPGRFGTCSVGTCTSLPLYNAHVQTPATSAPLPTLQDASEVPSSLSQGQGRSRPSSPQGPSSSCLLDSPPSCGLQAPRSPCSSPFFQSFHLSLSIGFFLHLQAGSGLPQHFQTPALSLLLTCTPFLTFPSLSNLWGHSSSALASPPPDTHIYLPTAGRLATPHLRDSSAWDCPWLQGPLVAFVFPGLPFTCVISLGPEPPLHSPCVLPLRTLRVQLLLSFQTQQPAQQLATASPRLAELHISSAQSGKAPVGFSPLLPVAAHYVMVFLIFLPDRKLCEGRDSVLYNVFMAAPQDFSWRLAHEHPIFVESMKGQINERINE